MDGLLMRWQSEIDVSAAVGPGAVSGPVLLATLPRRQPDHLIKGT